MGTRTREVAVAACFLVLASALAAVTAGFVPPIFGVSIVEVHENGQVLSQSSGSLLVDVRNSSAAFPAPSFEIASFPLANASFIVLPSGVAPAAHGVFRTNSSGEQAIGKLRAGSYTVTFTDLPMNISEPVLIAPNETTSVVVSLTSGTYREELLDLRTNQSGMVPAWTPGTVEIGSPTAPVGPGKAYLDLYYDTGQVAERVVRTPLSVTNATLRSAGSADVEWIAFQPERSVSLHGLVAALLSVYGSQTSVTTFEGVQAGP
ncbi:MAG: hypothetical protein ABSF83_11350 [Nitrososphaerales archaeon]|jgi:hypothetical protein